MFSSFSFKWTNFKRFLFSEAQYVFLPHPFFCPTLVIILILFLLFFMLILLSTLFQMLLLLKFVHFCYVFYVPISPLCVIFFSFYRDLPRRVDKYHIITTPTLLYCEYYKTSNFKGGLLSQRGYLRTGSGTSSLGTSTYHWFQIHVNVCFLQFLKMWTILCNLTLAGWLMTQLSSSLFLLWWHMVLDWKWVYFYFIYRLFNPYYVSNWYIYVSSIFLFLLE